MQRTRIMKITYFEERIKAENKITTEKRKGNRNNMIGWVGLFYHPQPLLKLIVLKSLYVAYHSVN